jgi:hypothetical protein
MVEQRRPLVAAGPPGFYRSHFLSTLIVSTCSVSRVFNRVSHASAHFLSVHLLMVFGDYAVEIALPTSFFLWHKTLNLAELVPEFQPGYRSSMKAAPIITVGKMAHRNSFTAEIPSSPNRETRID